MKIKKKLSCACVILVLSVLVTRTYGQVNVLTNRYNASRTAANLNETILNTSNVNTNTFGKLGSYSVDGVIYAQPLYVQGLTVNGATHNVLFVATMHDVIYAFDADQVGSAPLWTHDYRNAAAGITPDPLHIGFNPTTDAVVSDTFGISSTPVIDLPNNRIFFTTQTLENGTEVFRLHDVNILTGAELAETTITGSVPALGSAAAETFKPSSFAQRPALELADGQIWIGFGSRPPGDYISPWQGWLMTYNPNTLAQTGIFVTTRTSGNSLWQSGSGPAVDSNGNVYYLTGNGGTYNATDDFPETLLKMNYGSSLALSDWYTPDSSSGVNNYVTLDNYDLDLSCNGPVLIPGTDLVAFGSKTADVYVLHTGNLGKLTSNDTQLAQFFLVGSGSNYTNNDSDRIVGMAYWQQGSTGTLYVWPGQDTLHSYNLNSTANGFTPANTNSQALPGQPSTALSISANGGTAGTGILWAPVMNTTTENNLVGQPGILHAYNAQNLNELWNSNMVSTDAMGSLAKFVPPVVVNGKVYIANSATLSNYSAGSVTVYGLKASSSPSFGIGLASSTITLAAGNGTADVVSIKPVNGFNGSVTLSASGFPSGASYAIYPANPTASSTNLIVYVSPGTMPGSYPITMMGTSGSLTTTTTLPLIVSQQAQTITFPAVSSQKAGNSLTLAATATSGLAVSYASSTTTVCTVSGSTANLLSAGTCTITASQPGNATYSAAAPVSQSFSVTGATAPFSIAVGVSTFTLAPNSGGALAVTIQPRSGFTGSVTLTQSGIPSGVGNTFYPSNPTTGSTNLVIYVPAGTKAGSYTVTISGTSGTSTATTTFTLVIS